MKGGFTTEVSGPDEIAALQALLSRATKADAWLRAHPGLVKLADRALSFIIKTFRASWAIDLKILLDETPGILAEAEAHLPQAIFLLKEIQPAKTGIQGDIPIATAPGGGDDGFGDSDADTGAIGRRGISINRLRLS